MKAKDTLPAGHAVRKARQARLRRSLPGWVGMGHGPARVCFSPQAALPDAPPAAARVSRSGGILSRMLRAVSGFLHG